MDSENSEIENPEFKNSECENSDFEYLEIEDPECENSELEHSESRDCVLALGWVLNILELYSSGLATIVLSV